MTPPESVDAGRSTATEREDLRLLAETMERMAGEMALLRSRLDRSESLLEAIANRLAALASRDRPQPVTKDDLAPVLSGLLRHLERHAPSAGNEP